MNYFGASAVILCAIFYVVSCDPVVPCKLSDADCLEKISALVYSKFLEGDPKLGADNLDPMYHDLIEGNLATLKYKFMNTTIKGFKDCKTDQVKYDSEALTLHIDLLCPAFLMSGKYIINGRLILLPVEGSGDFSIKTKQYLISVETEIKLVSGKDGKSYLSMKNFKQKSEALDIVIFDFKNLFNGQKDLADVVHKFTNENWAEVTKEVQDPVFNANVKKIIKAANKIFKTLPVEDLISQTE